MGFIPLPSSIGITKRVAGANPAASAEVSDTVPAGKSWYLVAVSVSLVQGITQTPNPTIVIDDGANIVFQSPPLAAAQNASVTTQYTWAANLPVSGGGAATIATGPLPVFMVLPAGYRIRTLTAGIGANSDYGVPSYLVCELG